MKDGDDSILKLLQNMDEDFRLRMAVYAILAIACIVVFLLLWLLLRSVRIWYWKIETRTKALESIDKNLVGLREDIKRGAGTEMAFMPPDISKPTDLIRGQAEEIEITETQIKDECCRGKSGRLYTLEELEKQIKD